MLMINHKVKERNFFQNEALQLIDSKINAENVKLSNLYIKCKLY